MPLSEWPDKFKDSEDSREYVTVHFDDSMFVKVVTSKAVGLSEDTRGVGRGFF